MCFDFFITDFQHCFLGVLIIFIGCIFSCHPLSLPWLLFCCFFIRYFVFVLVYCKCYGFERAFSALRSFFILQSLKTFTKAAPALWIWESFFSLSLVFYLLPFTFFHSLGTLATVPPMLRIREILHQLAFIKVSLGSNRFLLKVAGYSTEVRNTDPAHLLVWITQCSAKNYYKAGSAYALKPYRTLYNPFHDSFHDCFFIRYFVYVLLHRECYGSEAAFFYSQAFFTLHSLQNLPKYRECYGFERAVFTLRCYLSYTPSRDFAQRDIAPTCIYQGFPGSWHFFLEGCRASHWGSKHKLGLSVC